MDCTKAAREEILERYLAGSLSEEDRDAFEEHYFGCARCFEELQALKAIRDELPRAVADLDSDPTRVLPRWAPAAALAAALVLAVGATLWMRNVPLHVSETKDLQPPSRPAQPGMPQPRASDAAVATGPSLEQLARFEPPRYEPLRVRGLSDEATARFQRGMEHYRRADYRAAVDDLRVAADMDPEAAHTRFFLGVAHLMLGQDDAGIARLRATIALGDSPYLEDAHFYLAKAFLKRKDFGAAETQLNALIRLPGSKSDEARRLLSGIQTLKERSD
jgi:tetratricopeptide (TPR) repeat protein